MEKYTDKELEEIINALNNSTNVSEEEFNEYFFKTIAVVAKVKNIPILEELDEEQILEFMNNVIMQIKSFIPKEKKADFFRNLDYGVFWKFYSGEDISEFPEIIGMIFRNCSYDFSIDRAIEQMEELDLSPNIIADNLDEILLDVVEIISSVDCSKVLKCLVKNVPDDKKGEALEKIIKSLMNRKYANDISKIVKALLDEYANFIDEKGLESIIDTVFKFKIGDDKVRCVLQEIFEQLLPELQKKAIDAVVRNMQKVDEKSIESIEVIFERISILFDVMDRVDREVLKEKFDILYATVNQNIINDDGKRFAERRIVPYYELAGTEEVFGNVSVEEMNRLFNEATYIDKYTISKIIGYTKYILETDENALTDNDFIAVLYSAIKNSYTGNEIFKNLSEKDIEKIKELFEKAKENKKAPDMSKYDTYISELSDMDENTFKSFISDLKKYRSVYGEFPEEYCDYIIKQKLISESYLNKNLDEYFSIVKRAFEDKTAYVLKAQGLPFYLPVVREITKEEKENPEKTVGTANLEQKSIILNVNNIYRVNEKYTAPINAIFHECRHVAQEMVYATGKPKNRLQYIMLKERILEKYERANGKGYYKRNYVFVASEIDARIIGNREERKYLRKLGFSKDIIHNDTRRVFEDYEQTQRKEISNSDTARHGRIDKKEQLRHLNDMFLECMQEHPEILEKFPVLRLEYNSNGTRKSSFDILREFDAVYEELKTKKTPEARNKLTLLISILIEKDNCQYQDVKMTYLDEILQYEPTTVSKKYRDRIIENELLPMIKTATSTGKLQIRKKDTEEEQKENFRTAIMKLNEFVRKNPDEKISKRILELIGPFITQCEQDVLAEYDTLVTPQERNEGMNISMQAGAAQQNPIVKKGIFIE